MPDPSAGLSDFLKQVDRSASDTDDEEDDEIIELEVLAENVQAVQVFFRCELRLVAGFGFIHWQEVAPADVHAACLLMRVPRHEWPDVLHGVQVLGRQTARIRNREAKAK